MKISTQKLSSCLIKFGASAGILCAAALTTQAVFAAGSTIEPSATATIEPTSRTVQEMKAHELAFFGVGGELPAQEVPFRPTTNDPESYAAAKTQMQTAAPEAMRTVVDPKPLAVSLTSFNITGLNSTQSGNLRPPDTHGASGGGKYCQIVNTQLACYARGGLFSKVLDVSLASFFNYTTQTIFDPRIEYDEVWDRWVVYAEAFAEDATTQFIFWAVSKTASPQAGWTIYKWDADFNNNGEFWDYGQLGMTQEAVVITANIFNPFSGARLLSLSKARLYNALPVSLSIFSGLDATLAPAKVLDQHKDMFLIAAPLYLAPGGTTLSMYKLSNAGNPSFITLTGPTPITVPAYSIPPDAAQLGTTDLLDTVDARFVNRSTQIGHSLFNAHTVAFNAAGSPFAAPEMYQIDTQTNTVLFSNKWFQSGDSSDFNVSVAVEANDVTPVGLGSPQDIYVTWTASSPTQFFPQMVVSGEQPPYVGIEQPGGVCAQSPTFYNPTADVVERWGDYSSVDLTTTGQAAEAVNETVVSNGVWGSQICRFKY